MDPGHGEICVLQQQQTSTLATCCVAVLGDSGPWHQQLPVVDIFAAPADCTLHLIARVQGLAAHLCLVSSDVRYRCTPCVTWLILSRFGLALLQSLLQSNLSRTQAMDHPCSG
eukprot:GHUV01029839.1.p2 GENE.GHUV01029839.1~~GHUV01029839.1.p2  ORF type:complete len:113 (+),score=31.30 GHUV01029839.1:66-404(+)